MSIKVLEGQNILSVGLYRVYSILYSKQLHRRGGQKRTTGCLPSHPYNNAVISLLYQFIGNLKTSFQDLAIDQDLHGCPLPLKLNIYLTVEVDIVLYLLKVLGGPKGNPEG